MAQYRSLLTRIILGREILVVLPKKKRLWIGGRSDQQGMAGNLRPKQGSLEESIVDHFITSSSLSTPLL